MSGGITIYGTGSGGIPPVLPDPFARSGGIRPSKRLIGIYIFHRRAFDEQITVYEPPPAPHERRNSFILEYFECENEFCRIVLKLEEEQRRRLFDLLWNFRCVALNTRTGTIRTIPVPRDEDLEVEQSPDLQFSCGDAE